VRLRLGPGPVFAYECLMATLSNTEIVLGKGDPIAGLIAAVCWTLLYFGLAATLFGATLATFDRCLGQIAKRRRPVVSRSGGSGVLGRFSAELSR
jgi:hypothetical protein